VRFQLLGSLTASGADGPLAIGGPKQRLVLAHLLLRVNHTVLADHLIDALWAEEPPDSARGTLQAYVSRLRGTLGSDRIEGSTSGYLFRADPAELDTFRFETLLQTVREDGLGPKAVVDVLDEALDLWRGPALADLASESSLAGEIARLEELRLIAIEERIEAKLDLGLNAEAVAELEAATAANPLLERLWALLVLALYRSGRQADALAAFERARSLLAEELGIDPSPELQDLHQRVLRQDESLRAPGGSLRGYQLLGKIGEGAFGVVYRAIQPQVEREVAIKAIHAELANQPDFVRRFEREAQLVARLEHPHIVPLYDYWREPDAAYLIMRFLRGGSLETLIDEGPLEPNRAADLIDQLGSALAAAHAQGVVHRDVKPGNVLLDELGNAYLSDFGIALETGAPEQTAGTMIRGTPAYLSPEQIRLEQTSARSDIYALGVVLYEMLTGGHPFPGASLNVLLDQHLHQPIPSVRELRPEIPSGVDVAIARATAKDPKARFEDVLELCAAYRGAIEGTGAKVVVPGEIRNPYKGLRAFLEPDSADFFGREVVTRRLLERLAERDAARFLCVVGPSGSGKSSVVRAGLVPAVRRGAIPGSERWFVIDLLPGSHPLRELERALLGVGVDPPPSLLEDLEQDEAGLVRVVSRLLPDPDAELLIVLDQLEELFTMVESDAERAHVLESIRVAASEPSSRVRVVATLRADFFDQPLSTRGFGDLLAARTEAITPMSPEELERAIVGPAERVGLDVEPGLVAAMVADVIDRPGALPLLQYALTEMADRENVSSLTLNAYRRVGGVSGALARRAEHLYEALDETAVVACRELFLRLVTVGEGTEDTRRRVRRSEIGSVDPATTDAVIETFGRHRLFSFDRDPATREPTLEIAHEALLRAWARLRRWIDEVRDDIRAERQLSAAAADWEAADRDPSFLLRGARLEQASAWREVTTLALSDQNRAFLVASLEQRDEERVAEEARVAKERALERRSVRRMRGLVAALTAAAVIASTLTVVTVGQRGQAQRQERIATARELASAALTNLEIDPQRSLLLALAAVDRVGEDEVLPEVEEALRRSLVAHREVLTFQGLAQRNAFAISPDGKLIVTAAPSGEGGEAPGLVVHDARTGTDLRALAAQEIADEGLTDIAYSPDGGRLAALTEGSTVIFWETRSWSRERTVNLGREISDAGSLAFGPDGRLLAAVGVDGIVSIMEAETGRELHRMRQEGNGLHSVAFSPDGAQVAATAIFGPARVPIWDVQTGSLVQVLKDPGATPVGIAYSPDGRRIATADNDGRVRVWNARTGHVVRTLDGHAGSAWGVAYSPDGRLIASAGDDDIRIWDADEGTEQIVLRGHEGTVWECRFTPDGDRLVTRGADGTVRVWDVSPSGSRELLTVDAWGDSVDYSPDGSRLLAADDGAVRQWNAHSALPVSAAPMFAWGDAVYSPEGDRFFTAGRPFVGDAEPDGEVREMDLGEGAFISSIAYSPDGTSVAGGLENSQPGLVYLWDVGTGARIQALGELGNRYEYLRGVAFSPDGQLLAGISGPGVVHIWDVTSAQDIRSWDSRTDNGEDISFSPDGTLVATAGAGGAALWSSTSGELVAQLRGHAGDVPDVAFSSDGTLAATAGEDGTARIWEVPTGRLLHTFFGHSGGVTSVAISPDGKTLATSGLDGTLREYVLDVDELIELASARLTRSLSDPECQRYLHVSPCPESVRSPSSVAKPAATTKAPEGAFRVTIVPTDLRAGFTDREIERNVGDYTLAMSDGTWRLRQELPDGATLDTSGTYAISGETITFTDLEDPGCFGASWTAEWTIEGTSLSFTDTGADPWSTCGHEPVPRWVPSRDRNGEGWAAAVFGSRPWTRMT
jgi:WD40 repeat protein/DNA-binding SARP family transcriptional activator